MNEILFIVPTLRRGNALGNAPALLTVTPERHYRIPGAWERCGYLDRFISATPKGVPIL
ncbi:MAG: hypothetical protein NTY50_11860 [Methylobacter sp.]|nr:hypothetical protein [Methylobacter sp.]